MDYIVKQTNIFIDFVNTTPNALVYLIVAILFHSSLNYFSYKISRKWLSNVAFFGTNATILFLLYFVFPQFLSIPVYLMTVLIPAMLISTAVSLVVTPKKSKVRSRMEGNPFQVMFETDQGTFYFDLIRGFAIFGAAGSGKTKSGFLPVIKHCAEFGLSGIIYDYKDFELSELVYYFFSDSHIDTKTVYLADPDYSYCVNPIDPVYMNQTADMKAVCKIFVLNLSGDNNNEDSFFVKAATGALSATAWRLKEEYPEKCNLPMAAGILLMNSVEQIAEFIRGSTHAMILGAPFLDSLGSEKQMAAVKATLSAAIQEILTPELTAVLSKSDFSLRVNDPENPVMMTVVNNILYDDVHSPVISMIIGSATRQMSRRNQNPSLLLLDEGSTIKLPGLHKIPARMRSFGIGTVWGLQDKVQGAILYDEKVTRATVANLSTKMFGKANDPETMKYYESFFELVDVEQKSYSKSDDLLKTGDKRVNISTQEKAKHRAQEFMKLKAGQFFMFDEDGESYKLNFKIPEYKPIPPKQIYNYSKTELEVNFENLLAECKTIISSQTTSQDQTDA